jgi:hypothetical protein
MLCQLLINELAKYESNKPIWVSGIGKIVGIVNLAVIIPSEPNAMVIDCRANTDGRTSMSSESLLSMLMRIDLPQSLIRIHVTSESYSDLIDIADTDPVTWHKDGTAEINLAG